LLFFPLYFLRFAARRADAIFSEGGMKDTSPQAVQAAHELLLWLIPQIDKVPRVRRFTRGERLESGLALVPWTLRLLGRRSPRGGVSGISSPAAGTIQKCKPGPRRKESS
jgi:hypothetical protein